MERLPLEITMDILSRLPIRCVHQCRFVCKTWQNIISDSEFCYMHMNMSHHQASNNSIPSLFDIIIDVGSHKNRVVYHVQEPILRAKKHDFAFIKKNSVFSFSNTNVVIMGSCNGLLSFSEQEDKFRLRPSNPIWICNPLLRDGLHSLPYFYPNTELDYNKKLRQCGSGLGFDVHKKEFKMVLVMFYKTKKANGLVEIRKNEVQLHTLGNDKSWRILDGGAPSVLGNTDSLLSSAFVNGCLHWMTVENLSTGISKTCIVSFRVGIEKFGFVPIPKSEAFVSNMGTNQDSLHNYGLGVLGEWLTITADSTTSEHLIDIWIMKNYNVKDSWVKQFSIQRCSLRGPTYWCYEHAQPLCIRNNGEILLLFGFDVLVSYNIERNEWTYLELLGINTTYCHSYEVFPIVGSLISVRMFEPQEEQTDAKALAKWLNHPWIPNKSWIKAQK